MRAPPGPRRVERSCSACRTRRDVSLLIRFVRTSDGGVLLDLRGAAQGRGAYTCMDPRCVSAGADKGQLARALRTKISPDRAQALKRDALEYLSSRGAYVEDPSS